MVSIPWVILPCLDGSETIATALREFGLVLGGHLRYGLLAVGLPGALFAHRRANRWAGCAWWTGCCW